MWNERWLPSVSCKLGSYFHGDRFTRHTEDPAALYTFRKTPEDFAEHILVVRDKEFNMECGEGAEAVTEPVETIPSEFAKVHKRVDLVRDRDFTKVQERRTCSVQQMLEIMVRSATEMWRGVTSCTTGGDRQA